MIRTHLVKLVCFVAAFTFVRSDIDNNQNHNHLRHRFDYLLRELADTGPDKALRRLDALQSPFDDYSYQPDHYVIGGGSVTTAGSILRELVIVDSTVGCHGILFSTDIVVTSKYYERE